MLVQVREPYRPQQLVDLNTGNVDGKTRAYFQEGRKDQSPKGSRPLGELVKQIRSRKGGDAFGATTVTRVAFMLGPDEVGYSGAMLERGKPAQPGVPRGDKLPLGLDKTFYMPAGGGGKGGP